MATRSHVQTDNKSTAASAMSPASSYFEDLVRLILAKTVNRANGASDQNGHRSEQIILDMPLDGERYLLVRMPKPSHTPLSPRELEIVRMVAQGHSNKIIADVLSISAWTVCTHVRRIFAKLGVGSRAAMVARLLECGALTQRAQNGDRARFELSVAPNAIGGSLDSRTSAESIDAGARVKRRSAG